MSEWIECSERMPETGQWVLVWTWFAYGAQGVSVAHRHIDGWHSPDEWVACKSITHWQPLPEPPKIV